MFAADRSTGIHAFDLGSVGSDLCDTAIRDQVDTGAIAAVLGCQEQNGRRHLFRAADATKRRDP